MKKKIKENLEKLYVVVLKYPASQDIIISYNVNV